MENNRKGNQKPRIDIYKDGDIELAEKVIKLINHYGVTLLPWQKGIVRRWLAQDEDGHWVNDNCGLSVPRQNGKDIAESTLIPTPNGWTTMGDIKIGDYVFGDDGKPTKVIAKYEPDEKNFYEIDFGNAGNFINETVKAGGGHLWEVMCNDWIRPKIVDTNWLFNNFERMKSHKCTFKVRLAKPVEYQDKELPIDPYILGLWLGDGSSCSGGMSCHIDDYPHYKKWFEDKIGKCTITKVSEKGTTIEFKVDGFFRQLRLNNLINNKHIPTDYLTASPKQRLELLRGLMDTDGSAEKHSSAVSFAQSGRPELVSQIMELICSLGMKPSYRVKKIEGAKDCQEIRFNVIGDHVFKLQRKKDKFDEYYTKKQLFNYWYIKGIRKIEKTERYFCLGVDNDSHLFLCTRSFIPTHNTEMLIARIIAGMIFKGEKLVYTAHVNSTATEIKRRVFRFFYDAEPEIRNLLTAEFDKEPKSFDYVELRNGGRCIFSTRTRSAMLGTTNDVILIDECLPADTIVDGKPIQDYKVGDMVRTFDKNGNLTTRKVTRTIKKKTPEELAMISGKFGCIISTRNHKHLTQRGWVRADEITEEDYLYVETQPSNGEMDSVGHQMQPLQEATWVSNGESEKILREEKDMLLLKGMCECRSLDWNERRAQEKQSNVESGKQGKDDRNLTKHELEASSTQGQWPWGNNTTEDSTRSSWDGLASRICARYSKIYQGAIQCSDMLQNGSSKSKHENCNRSGWEKPLWQEEETRCKEINGIEPVRVESVQIQKREYLRGLGLSDGGDYVYCIDVEETHNFIADGIITHNCQEYTDAQEEALRPTVAAGHTGNSQIIMTGTPPVAGSSGTVFLRTRNNIFNGKGGSWCWQEWSVEHITTNDDKEAWYQTNPSLGYFLQERAIENESVTMAQDSFNKMRLGWFAGIDSQRCISDEEWNPLALKEVKLPENPQLVYSVKFAPDRSAVTLAVGVIMGDKVHVEIVERKPMSQGTSWLTAWLLARWRKANKIIIDGAAGTQLLVEDLIRSDKRIQKKILTPNVKEAGAAYAGFTQAITDKTLTHYNQPILNSAIRTCKRRDIGRDGMFGFAPLNPAIQTDPVEAVAFALYGAVRFKNTSSNTCSTQRIMI